MERNFKINALHGVLLLIFIVVIISAVTYMYVESMGDHTEGYIYSSKLVDNQYYKIMFGATEDPLDSLGEIVLMNVEYDNVEPFEIGDHIQFYYDVIGQHFRIYKVTHLWFGLWTTYGWAVIDAMKRVWTQINNKRNSALY